MLCEICHENEARITYTEIINGVRKEQHLCEKCAAKQSPFSNIAGNFKIGPDVPFGNILSGLLQSFAKGLGAMQQKESICGRCGMTASEFAKTGRLGCPDCYAAFAPILDKNLRTLQGAVENKAKRPMNAVYFEPAKYDPSSMPDMKEQDPADSGETTGSVLGTAGTIDDILKMDESDIVDKPKKSRKNSKESTGNAEEGKTTGRSAAGKSTKAPSEGKSSKTSARSASKTGASGKQTLRTKDNPEIAALRKKMEKAVKAEDYEEAARLRDRIHELEK